MNTTASAPKAPSKPVYNSMKDVATPTGTLSDQESEVFELVNEWQTYLYDRLHNEGSCPAVAAEKSITQAGPATWLRASRGSCPTEADARTAFLLLFGELMELNVMLESNTSKKETVW